MRDLKPKRTLASQHTVISDSEIQFGGVTTRHAFLGKKSDDMPANPNNPKPLPRPQLRSATIRNPQPIFKLRAGLCR
jgi:hypothetical protein